MISSCSEDIVDTDQRPVKPKGLYLSEVWQSPASTDTEDSVIYISYHYDEKRYLEQIDVFNTQNGGLSNSIHFTYDNEGRIERIQNYDQDILIVREEIIDYSDDLEKEYLFDMNGDLSQMVWHYGIGEKDYYSFQYDNFVNPLHKAGFDAVHTTRYLPWNEFIAYVPDHNMTQVTVHSNASAGNTYPIFFDYENEYPLKEEIENVKILFYKYYEL